MFSRRRSGKQGDTSGPHRFAEPQDLRSGLALGSGTYDNDARAMFSVAAASVRQPACARPGCGKAREDPIHWPED
ncbi:MAG: hypothetical protein QOH61_482 [Chloroflexota bacterium]|jgi:hypothetical protein|nr:hypothetical protein [Chloroflexota bacterium]